MRIISLNDKLKKITTHIRVVTIILIYIYLESSTQTSTVLSL